MLPYEKQVANIHDYIIDTNLTHNISLQRNITIQLIIFIKNPQSYA